MNASPAGHGKEARVIDVLPVITGRFEDLYPILAPKRPDAPAGWCSVSPRSSHHRLRSSRSSAFAYVGTTRLFESMGFERVVATSSKSGSMTRWLMRLELGG